MRRSSSLSRLAALCAALVLPACHDVTSPRPAAPPSAASGGEAAPPGTIVVHPGAMHGWAFAQHDALRPCGDTLACRLVTGPRTPPLGTGSAELASTRGEDASLARAMPGGIRLDNLTSLAYSTYGASDDAVMTLELSIDFNLDGRSTGDAGVITHVPSPTDPTPGSNAWHRRNALAGRWWSDRQAPRAVGGAAAHPCVRARPCTWAELLARYPAIGLHRTQGAVRLTMPRGDGLRGNVDDVLIGIGGVDQRFDFEAEAPKVSYLLARDIGAGVVAEGLPADTLLRAGTSVTYAFTARPGHAPPVVLLDDTLAAASGRIVMDAPHALVVVSDTLYSLAGLTPIERRAADLTRALLDATDRVSAAMAFNEFLVSELVGGTEPGELARAVELADYLTVDPVRDSLAVRLVDEALAGHQFNFGYGGPGSFSAWDPAARAAPSLAASALAPSGARADRITAPEPENPREATKVIYTNGISSYRGTAFVSASMLAQLLFTRPRFANYYTSVIYYYNPTYSAHMAEYDRLHPCVAGYERGQRWSSPLAGMVKYASCRAARFSKAVVSVDLVESVRARSEIQNGLAPTTATVSGLAQVVADLRGRSNNSHVLLVGHSEGTILQEQVVRALPALEGHPLNVANRCLGVLALAPATSRLEYGMDEYHLAGLLARNDIIRYTLPVGWESIDTPFSQLMRDSIARSGFAPILEMRLAAQVHSVNSTYLAGNVAPVVLNRLVSLHRECIPGSAELEVETPIVPLGDRVTATLSIWNQNQRPLLGRETQFAGAGYFFDLVGASTFRAMAPYDGQLRIGAFVTQGLIPEAPVRIPLVRPDFMIRETPLWSWVVVAAGDAPNGGYAEVPAPVGTWDGMPGTCPRRERLVSAAGNWQEYEMRCNRVYTPVFVRPDTLPTGRRVVRAEVRYTGVDGVEVPSPTTSYFCAGTNPCVTSGYVEWFGELGVVARSLPVIPVISTSGASSLVAGRFVQPERRAP